MTNGAGATATAESTGKRPTDIGIREILIAGGAGLVGMLAMIPFFAVGYVLGVISPEAFAGLAELLGVSAGSPLAFPLGAFIFVGGGMTTLPLLFVALAEFLPPARSIGLRGVTFAVVIWTGFLIAFWTGQSGILLGGYVVVSLLAHVAYGYVLGTLFGRFARIPRYEV